jgi:hypothetical protein
MIGEEGVKGLFPDTFKTPTNKEIINQIWRDPNLSPAQKREKIRDISGGFKAHPGIPIDCVLEGMKRDGAKITRASYLRRAYGKNLPEWTPELESELPEELQDWPQFEKKK